MNCVVCGSQLTGQTTSVICRDCTNGNKLESIQRKRANDEVCRLVADRLPWLEKWLSAKSGRQIIHTIRADQAHEVMLVDRGRILGSGPTLSAAINNARGRGSDDNSAVVAAREVGSE